MGDAPCLPPLSKLWNLMMAGWLAAIFLSAFLFFFSPRFCFSLESFLFLFPPGLSRERIQTNANCKIKQDRKRKKKRKMNWKFQHPRVETWEPVTPLCPRWFLFLCCSFIINARQVSFYTSFTRSCPLLPTGCRNQFSRARRRPRVFGWPWRGGGQGVVTYRVLQQLTGRARDSWRVF